MKKLISCLIAIFIALLPFTVVFAAGAEIYCNNVQAKPGESVVVQVNIKNNPGIMGFKISVEYDRDVFYSPIVSKGNVTENGMINDSIGSSVEGKFDVVWSSTSDATEDGTLFTAVFMAYDDCEDDSAIKLSYSKQDTFNENWEPVEINIKDINVSFSSVKTPIQTAIQKPFENREIINAYETELKIYVVSKAEDIPHDKKDDFASDTVELIKDISGSEQNDLINFDSLSNAYESAVAEEYITDVYDYIEPKEVEEIINNCLDIIGAKDISEIPVEKQNDFVQLVENAFNQKSSDLKTISDKISEEKAFETIKQIADKEAGKESEAIPVPDSVKANTADNKTLLVCTCVITLVLVLLFIAVVIYKLKRKKTFEEDFDK